MNSILFKIRISLIFSLLALISLQSIVGQNKSPKPVKEDNSPLAKGTFIDSRDNKSYNWVELRDGNIWMADNLDYGSDDSCCFKDKQENCDKWGKLYKFNAALKACPQGWHLPSQKEWTELLVIYGKPKQLHNDYLGYDASKRAFQLLKENGEAELGLQKSGLKVYDGFMSDEDGIVSGFYWSSTKVDEDHASYYQFNTKSARITRWNQFDINRSAFSCRCVKNPKH